MAELIYVRDDFDGSAGVSVGLRAPNVAAYGSLWGGSAISFLVTDGTGNAVAQVSGMQASVSLPQLPGGNALANLVKVTVLPNGADISTTGRYFSMAMGQTEGGPRIILKLLENTATAQRSISFGLEGSEVPVNVATQSSYQLELQVQGGAGGYIRAFLAGVPVGDPIGFAGTLLPGMGEVQPHTNVKMAVAEFLMNFGPTPVPPAFWTSFRDAREVAADSGSGPPSPAPSSEVITLPYSDAVPSGQNVKWYTFLNTVPGMWRFSLLDSPDSTAHTVLAIYDVNGIYVTFNTAYDDLSGIYLSQVDADLDEGVYYVAIGMNVADGAFVDDGWVLQSTGSLVAGLQLDITAV